MDMTELNEEEQTVIQTLNNQIKHYANYDCSNALEDFTNAENEPKLDEAREYLMVHLNQLEEMIKIRNRLYVIFNGM